MKEHLTICYVTSRKDPKFEWFLESLKIQCNGDYSNLKLVVVDIHSGPDRFEFGMGEYWNAVNVPPKPNIWQGEHRLTKQDWFAAANARNTGLCLAPDGWLAFADDLSVLMPGWLNCVKQAMEGNYIVCGAYRKVWKLQVVDGQVSTYIAYPAGEDSRWPYATSEPCPAQPGWLYGCSCAMPVEALLQCNGWPEICDSIGSEDYCLGAALVNNGFDLKYDRRMLTLESDEYHFTETPMRREDWHFVDGKPVTGGNGHDDCSHAILNIALQTKRFEYYVGDGFADMRALRQHVLNGGQFPIRKHPEHHWYSKVALKDL